VRLTFDNLGEAAELERGTWPADAPLGRHRSVTDVLPRLLTKLDARGLRATFFVEGINCELYPEALREIDARGHVVGVHGWRHEAWAQLPAARERERLLRADRAFRDLGLAPRGFRPPGGAVTAQTAALLGELGYTWWSRAAPAIPVSGLDDLTFEWDRVDAYWLMERFADRRRVRGDPGEPMAPSALGERLARAGRGEVLVLHPFLMLDEAWWEQVCRLLELVGR
jgi:peptidoglycan/xylan/chitin deacetylase (PgdA/CDA1 family)